MQVKDLVIEAHLNSEFVFKLYLFIVLKAIAYNVMQYYITFISDSKINTWNLLLCYFIKEKLIYYIL